MRSSAPPERSARGVAFRVLVRVDVDRAFASMALDAETKRARLDPRDARLATRIVYGTLRELEAIDRAVGAHLARSGKLDAAARAALRASAYQLGALDRVPPHAVVDEAVRWVNRERGPRVGGFVNAVLRKLASSPPRLESTVTLEPAVEEALHASIGEGRAEALLSPGSVPTIDLRVRLGTRREAVLEAIRAAVPEGRVVPCSRSPIGIRTERVGDPRVLPGFRENDFVVQEEGSQLVALLLGTKPGDRVLDVCAGRGGKTTLLAELATDAGSVVATDLHEHRLAQIESAFRELGLRARLTTSAVDWTVGDGGVGGDFDRVLVDAPCSGLGTIGRRPEIARRLTHASIDELAVIQRAIATRAARAVRPGGVLVYAVCSLLDAESRDAVAPLAEQGMRPLPFEPSETFGVEPEPDGSLVLGPHLGIAGDGTDGYRIFRFERVDSRQSSG